MPMLPAQVRAVVCLLAGSFFACGLAAQSLRGRALQVTPGKAGFTLLAPSVTAVQFTNAVDEFSAARNRTLENGAGVAAGDVDRDGLPDIFLCSLSGGSRLFRNEGDWRFRDVTEEAGLPIIDLRARGAVFADINGDASPDLLLATIVQGVRCFTNNASGRLVECGAANTRTNLGVTTLALADVDKNGMIDLFVTTYRTDDIRDRARIDIQRVGGKVVVGPALRDRIVLTSSGLFEFGEPDILYLNDGKGSFTPARESVFSREATAVDRDWGLAAAIRDLNLDGWPDLYICNDYWTPDRLWVNAAGTFHAVAADALPHSSENSMGVDFADINGDGLIDFFVTDMQSRDPVRRHRHALAQATVPPALAHLVTRPSYMQNTLFLNRGDGTYSEIAEFAGVSASEWSWQPTFMDIDLDALPDLLIPAGHTRDVQDLDATEKIRRMQHAWPPNMPAEEMQRAFTQEIMEHARLYPRYDAPIGAFRNNGDLTFSDMTSSWGTDQLGVHQGMACADFDGDGDLDLVVNNLNSAAGLYRNDVSKPRLAIRLHGRSPNTSAVGAVVRVRGHERPPQLQEVTLGGKYLSGFDTMLMFAAGDRAQVDVTWPNGKEWSFPAEGNHAYDVYEEQPPAP